MNDTVEGSTQASELGKRLLALNAQITTAESCTGGLLAGAITDIAGSSAWFTRSVVTYSNDAKQSMLGVSPDIFEQHGAVSEACVRAMVVGALKVASAQVAIAVSGIAGPGGATAGKPVGTVWIAWALAIPSVVDNRFNGDSELPAKADLQVSAESFGFSGDRLAVRHQAVVAALRGTILRIDQCRIC